jgi:hypothetical protein
MYLVQVDHVVYERKGGGTFTLPEAMREVRGVGYARVLRADLTVVVSDAGSTAAVLHVPSGRVVHRRAVRR